MISISKILVPVDFSACSKVALDYAIFFGNKIQAKTIDVLHVWKPQVELQEAKIQTPDGREQTLGEFVVSKAGQQMKEFLAEIEAGGDYEVHGRLESGEPQQAILQAAEAGGYDMIIMGTHGVSQSAKLGSIAQKIVRNAACPVLTIRTTCP